MLRLARAGVHSRADCRGDASDRLSGYSVTAATALPLALLVMLLHVV